LSKAISALIAVMFLAGCTLALKFILVVTDDSQTSATRSATSPQAPSYTKALLPAAPAVALVQTSYSSSSAPKTVLVKRKHARLMSPYSVSGFKKPLLPPELVDEIIDYLHSDKHALMACTLTHRNWLPRARFHLFHSLLVRKHGKDPYRLRFYPNVARYVREVVIRGNLCSEVANSALIDDASESRVESLRLEGSTADWVEVQWELNCKQLPKFPRLKTLSLNRVYFRSFAEMVNTLHSLKGLESLEIDFEDWRYSMISPKDASLNRGKMLSLKLETLKMRVNSTGTLPGMIPQILLDSTAKTLKHLSLEILTTSSGPTSLTMSCLDLTRCTVLESMSLSFPWVIEEPPWVPCEDERRLAGSILYQICSPNFHQLIFRISFPSSEQTHSQWLRQLDLGFIDSVMEPEKSSHMTHLEIERTAKMSKQLDDVRLELDFSKTLSEKEFGRMKKEICKQLPGLATRGILTIVKAAAAS